jgi:hypothetical protein
MRHANECKHSYYNILALIHKLQLAFHFGYYMNAKSILYELQPIMKEFRSDLNYFTWHFFASMAYYSLYHRYPGQGKYIRLARKHKRKLQCERKEFRTCPNSTPLSPLLDAEDLFSRITRKRRSQQYAGRSALVDAYDAAIKALATARFVNMEALANERAGFAFCEVNDQFRARNYFSRALQLYDEWGATAKGAWLKEKVDISASVRNIFSDSYNSKSWVGNTIAVPQSLHVIEEESSSMASDRQLLNPASQSSTK